MSRWILFATLVSWLATASVARGDDQRSAAAQLAFDEATALFDRGDYAAACPKYEASLELEEAVGARFALAECYEKIAKLGSAWRSYVRASDNATTAGETDKATYAKKRADALRPRVPTVTIMLPEAVKSLRGMTVAFEGAALDATFIGTAMPMDPGTHRFTLGADGHTPTTREIVVTNASGGQTLTFPALVPAARPDRGVPPIAIAGIAVGAAGLVVVGVSIGLAAAASGDYHDAEQAHCANGRCSPEGLELTEDARSQGDVASVLFGVGAGVAAVGIGLTVFGFTLGGGDEVAITVVPTPGSLTLRGTF